MDQFQERLARLAELEPDELSALETELVAAFDAADEAGNLEEMQAYADALDLVRAEISNRSGEAAPAEPAQVAASAAEDDTEGDDVTEETTEGPEDEESADEAGEATEGDEGAAEGDTTEESETESEDTGTEAEAEGDATDESESESAEAGDNESESEEQVAPEITADDVAEEHSPVTAAAPVTIRAGGDVPGITAGTVLESMDEVYEALTKKVTSMRGIGSGGGERIIVASIRSEVDVPEDRTLRPGDAEGNSRKIREYLGDRSNLTPAGITAAAPWCAPRMPLYEVPTVGTTRRPVRDSLPSFNAERGGITWMEPPTLPDIAGAYSLWRADPDTGIWSSYLEPDASDEGQDTKPCLDVECGAEANADVDALPICLTFPNTTSRAFPEWIRANTDLTMVAQARFAEQVLLTKMFAVAATGSCGSVNTQLGAARDFLSTVRTSAAFLRWSLRLDAEAPLQLLAPAWVATAMAVDLGIQAPGDDTWVTGIPEITQAFNVANVDPIWFIDDVPGQLGFTTCAFPAQAHWMLYPTGTFLRLDAGELNLGVVRTKEDVQKNKYSEFSETFETVAYMGPAGAAWMVRGLTEIDILGGAAALIDTTA